MIQPISIVNSSALWLILLLDLPSRVLASSNAINDEFLYTNVESANTTASYYLIKNLPLNYYEFIYDSVPGRRQLGVLGPDAMKYFPESVEIVSNYSIPNKDRKLPSIIIPNFPLVDKSVIFTHGIAAVKELSLLYDSLSNSLREIFDARNRYDLIIDDIEKRMHFEISSQEVSNLIF